MWKKLAIVLVVGLIHFISGSEGQGPAVSENDGMLIFKPYPNSSCNYEVTELLQMQQSAALFANISQALISVLAPSDNKLLDMLPALLNGKTNFNEALTDVALSYVGIIIVLVLIMILACFVPCIGFIFCCCRCCGNCGGNDMQMEEDNNACRRLSFVGILIIVTLLLGFGCASVFVGESTLITTGDTVQSNLLQNVDDLTCYSKSIGLEFDYLIQTILDTLDLVFSEVNDIGDSVQLALEDNVMTTADNIKALDKSVQDVQKTLALIKTVQEQAENLDGSLSSFASNFQFTLNSTACSFENTCTGLESNFVAAKYTTNIDFSSVVDISSQLETLEEILAQQLTQKADELSDQLNSVSDMFADIIDTELNTTAGVVEFPSFVNDFLNITASFEDVQKTFEQKEVTDLIGQVKDIGFIFGIVLAICIGLIAVLYVLGIIFGEIGRHRDDEPMERTCLANSGGCMLIFGWCFTLLFYFCIAWLAAIFFLFGSLGETFLCRPLADRSIVTLAQDLLPTMADNGSGLLENINFSSALENCKDNQGLYNAFNFDELLGDELDGVFDDISETFDAGTFITDNLNFSDLIEFNARSSLKDLSNINFDNVDFGNLSTELDKELVILDLVEQKRNITMAANGVANLTLIMDLKNHNTSLGDIIQDLENLQDNVNILKAEVNTLEANTTDLLQEANNTITSVDDLLKEVQVVINMELQSLVLKLNGYVPMVLDHTKNEIKENIGGCRPLYNLYDSVDYILCDTIVDSLNAIWLGLVIAIIFFIFGIIFSVKLSKFYKRMLYDANEGENHNRPYGQQPDEPNYEMQNYKV